MALLPQRRSTLAPERWEPFRELDEFSERMRRMLEQSFGDLSETVREAAWMPRVDVEETEDAFLLEAELPGVKREDVDVELVDRELVISGELRERERRGILRRRARRTGQFEYRVTLPGDFDRERIEANLAEGVLSVRVPKSERAQRKQIEVRSS